MSGDQVRFWRYSLKTKNEPRGDWAIVFLDSRGSLAAVSSYGGYGYYWGAHGCRDFREFVMGLGERGSFDYPAGKLSSGRERVFNGDKTLRAIKDAILEGRRESPEFWTRERARREWDIACGSGMEDDGIVGFQRWYEQTQLDEAHYFGVFEIEAQIRAFCRDILPRLAVLLRAELEAEGYFATEKTG